MDRSAAPPAPLKLLLVDDSPEGRRALSQLLELYGFAVTSAADGASGLAALAAGGPFDVVLTDLLLPDLNGREVARAARALVPPPVIALITGWDIAEEVDDLRTQGIDHIFLKPLDLQQVVATLRAAAAGRSPSP